MNLALFATQSCPIVPSSCMVWPRWSPLLTQGRGFPHSQSGSGLGCAPQQPTTWIALLLLLSGTSSVENWILCSSANLCQHLLRGMATWCQKNQGIRIAYNTNEDATNMTAKPCLSQSSKQRIQVYRPKCWACNRPLSRPILYSKGAACSTTPANPC